MTASASILALLKRRLKPLAHLSMPAEIRLGATAAQGEIHPVAVGTRRVLRHDNVLVHHDAIPINLPEKEMSNAKVSRPSGSIGSENLIKWTASRGRRASSSSSDFFSSRFLNETA